MFRRIEDISEEKLRMMYYDLEMTLQEIANDYKCSAMTISGNMFLKRKKERFEELIGERE